MAVVVLIVAILVGGCASGSPLATVPRSTPTPTVDADALVRRGCYRCLESAFAAASAAREREIAFEAAVLLAARAKELGLRSAPWMVEARATLPPGAQWAEYLAIVEALPPDPLSDDRDRLLNEDSARRRPRDVYDMWREALMAGPGSPVLRAYLTLAIVCRPQQFDGRDETVHSVLQQFADVPLLRYRAGLCGGADAGAFLGAVRDADADFVDADLELGRLAIQGAHPNVDEALGRFRSAAAAFPESPVIPELMGDLHQGREDWPQALEMYAVVLTLVPTHRDALLGTTIGLTHLTRYEEAIVAATRLIDLGSWLIGQAHYWRAWNEFQLGRIQAARTDADGAKALMRSAPTYVLSGLIEWREQRLESSEAEFVSALDMDFGQCDAALYLGGVRGERRKWPEGLAAFQHAQQCLDLSIVTRRTAISALAATEAEAAANAREIASHERAIADAEKRRAEATQGIAALQSVIGRAGP